MHGRTEQHTVAQAPVLARAHSALSSTPTTFDPTAKYKNRLELCPLICSAPRPTPVQPATNHGSRLRCVIAVATALFHLLATEMPMRRQVAASGTTTSKLALPPAGHHQRPAAANDEDEAAKAGKRLPFDCGRAPPACSVLGAPSAAVDRVVGDRGWRVGTGRQRETARAGAPAVV